MASQETLDCWYRYFLVEASVFHVSHHPDSVDVGVGQRRGDVVQDLILPGEEGFKPSDNIMGVNWRRVFKGS